ncbi:hypothetical protein COT48_03075 [Candidatus Woesearchaeota archaeon CG08_land_8_20_14_0_20_47_9]|nr:MAG: hypothetical protein AUJ69_03180 [Candidatus Woesearchaeota archaeon CG1_02_47_18]PIO03909.1 MAG: hypothetical protein COT48_03075 [Candidatus Woesearchaeota archaeon CG08_land_8_20_14_0_20_47_9]
MLIATLTLACLSATAVVANHVAVVGKIYDAGHNHVGGADVTAICDGVTKGTTSEADGDYVIDFTGTDCNLGDDVTVTAVKGDQSGMKSGKVKDFNTCIDLAIVNVTLIPEFSVLAAGVAVGGSALAFAMLRKRS